MTSFFPPLCSVAGGVTILSTGLIGAYHAAGGMIGSPRRRRSFMILTMIQVSRDRCMISLESELADELIMDWKTTFIAIAIIITVSSASKLQAKAGLPLVNQVVGWVVLGE
jgi:hypothetical protein